MASTVVRRSERRSLRNTGVKSASAEKMRILVKLATNNASKLAGDNASTCPLQKELQAES